MGWMKFTIRDLLWLMVVVGLALGWLHEYRNSNRLAARQLAALVQALEARYLKVSMDSTYVTIRPAGQNASWNQTVELAD
jgi:hypothetical protein